MINANPPRSVDAYSNPLIFRTFLTNHRAVYGQASWNVWLEEEPKVSSDPITHSLTNWSGFRQFSIEWRGQRCAEGGWWYLSGHNPNPKDKKIDFPSSSFPPFFPRQQSGRKTAIYKDLPVWEETHSLRKHRWYSVAPSEKNESGCKLVEDYCIPCRVSEIKVSHFRWKIWIGGSRTFSLVEIVLEKPQGSKCIRYDYDWSVKASSGWFIFHRIVRVSLTVSSDESFLRFLWLLVRLV